MKARRSHRRAILIALLAIALGACGAGAAASRSTAHPGTGNDSPVPGGPRPAPLIYRPSDLASPRRSRRVPLVIALHASGGTPASFAAMSGWDRVAYQHRFVVAYLGSAAPAWKSLSNVGYISAMITKITASQHIDSHRVFVTGFSAGADATWLVACHLSGRVAAVAPVSGVLLYQPCRPKQPVSVLQIFGTHDLIPLTGTSRFPGPGQMVAMWRQFDHCPSGSPRTSVAGPVTQSLWAGCAGHSAVAYYLIHGGTHTYPGGPGLPNASADAHFDATSAIWAFFAAHAAAR